MIEIDDNNHIPVLISSLDKIYNKSKITGSLSSKNLYILNIVFKLLNGCCLTLNNEQRRKLMAIYSSIYFNSQDICKVKNLIKYQIPVKTKFFQAETIDCNTYPKFENVFYWQEEDYSTTYNDLLPLVNQTGYFTNKQQDSLISFNEGKLINYTNIGRLCFAILESNNSSYNLIDILNNNVTDTFDTHYYQDINTTLFVSKYIYSNGEINFKIIKT